MCPVEVFEVLFVCFPVKGFGGFSSVFLVAVE